MTVLQSNKPGIEGQIDLAKQMIDKVFPSLPENIRDALAEILGPLDIDTLSDEEFEDQINLALDKLDLQGFFDQNGPFLQNIFENNRD